MKYNHFNVMVIGENPSSIMSEYDSNLKVEPYLLYEYKKASTYRANAIKMYRAALSGYSEHKAFIRELLNDIETMSDMEYYEDFTSAYDHDENGNVYSNENLKGEWVSFEAANQYAYPFILKDGSTSFSAYKKDIDWDKMDACTKPYEIAWETVIENREPKTDEEKRIYNNMNKLYAYISSFKTKSNYVDYSTKFWTYAVADKDKWINCNEMQDKWIKNYYDKFIKKLPDDTLLTIFEYIRKN